MGSQDLTRRTLLQQAGIAGGLSLFGHPFVESSRAQPAVSSSPIAVRRDIATLDPNGPEIAALRQGIQVMKSRPASDPTSWLYQANIHGTYDTPSQAGWNQCQHGSFFFLSWHRMYLYFFERILRAASGDATLALPYWNYSNPAAQTLPLPFRVPADTTNPLYVAERNPDGGGINNGASLPTSATSFTAAFAYTNFASRRGSGSSFGGQTLKRAQHFATPHGALESQPHDVIHVLLGGDTGWMSDPNTAARDPIFWLHHANIDRLWKRWLAQGGGRQNPVTNQEWMQTVKYTFFNEQGQSVSMSGANIVDTEALPMGYRYDDDPSPAVAARMAAAAPLVTAEAADKPPKVLATGPAQRVELGADPVTVTIALPEEARTELARTTAAGPQEALVLTLEGIDYPKASGTFYEVYLNLPPDLKDPDPQSIYYAGNLSFFALKAHHPEDRGGEAPERTYSLDITGIVQAQRQRTVWNEEKVTVTFIPRGLVPAPGKAPEKRQGTRGSFTKVTITRE